jgi:homoserine dehydrogenase
MACTHKDSCGLFRLITLNSALMIWQTFYCDGKHETCERFQLSLAGKPVPPSLLPNGRLLDMQLRTDGSAAGERRAAATVAAAAPAQPAPAPAARSAPPAAAPVATASAASAPALGAERAAFYVRVLAEDSPQMQEQITAALRDVNVRVDALVKKAPPGDDHSSYRCYVLLTDEAMELDVYRALLRIEEIRGVLGKAKCIRLERLEFPALSSAA